MKAPIRCILPMVLSPLLALVSCDKPASSNPAGPTLGIVLMQQDQFFRHNEAGMKSAAEKAGARLLIQNAAGALDKELAIIDTFIAQKVSAIIVSPLNSQGSTPALRRAFESGIKIITYNNDIPADFVASRIASDQAALGTVSGGAARAYVETKLGGKARIALIGFASQLPEQGGARLRGFRDEIQKLPGIEIIAQQDAWEAAQAATAVAELLTKSPDLIWAANEGGTVGAVTAVRNAGKAGHIVVFGTDISSQLVDFLLLPENILQAVTAQKPLEMGAAAVESALKAIHNEALERNQTLPGELFSRDDPDRLRAYQKSLAP